MAIAIAVSESIRKMLIAAYSPSDNCRKAEMTLSQEMR